MGAGSHVISVLAYAIANARPPEGDVELNPKLLAILIGEEEERISQAMEYLSAPDEQSRSRAEEGRRIVPIGGFTYRLVNWLEHRFGREAGDRKEYFAQKQREYRERKKEKRVSKGYAKPSNTLPEVDNTEALQTPLRSVTDVTPDKGFENFWKAYPNKVAKAAAVKAWKKVDVNIVTILIALERQKKSEAWTKEGGKFIPHPSTWLNGRRWEDEAQVDQTEQPWYFAGATPEQLEANKKLYAKHPTRTPHLEPWENDM